MRGKLIDHRLRQALQKRTERGIASEQIDAGEGRRLVEDFVRVGAQFLTVSSGLPRFVGG